MDDETRSRTFSDAEFLTLWRALEPEGDPAFGAFAMLAYTGARRREVTQDAMARARSRGLRRGRCRQSGARPAKKDPEPFVIHLHPSAVCDPAPSTGAAGIAVCILGSAGINDRSTSTMR